MSDNEFFKAVSLGDIASVRQQLERNLTLVNERNESEDTAVHVLLLSSKEYELNDNQQQILNLLIQRGANLNFRGYSGYTPLHLAVIHHGISTIELLLKNGANITRQYNLGQTAMHYALIHQREDLREKIIKLLLQYGAKIDPLDADKATPLMSAVKMNNIELVKILVEAGAQINYNPARIDEYTMLGMACKNLNIRMVDYLMEKGAEVRQIGLLSRLTPLHAVIRGNFDLEFNIKTQHVTKYLVNLLLKNGVNINARDFDRKTALEYAFDSDNEELIKILLEASAGTFIDWRSSDYNKQRSTLLNKLLESSSKKRFRLIRLFIEYGATIKLGNRYDKNPFHKVVDLNQVELMYFIVAKMMKLCNIAYLKNENKLFAWSYDSIYIEHNLIGYSTILGYEYIVDSIIESQYDINRGYEKTPLCLAIETKQFRIAKMLLDAGCHIDKKNADEESALYYAVNIAQNVDLTCLLLDYNANMYDVNIFKFSICKELKYLLMYHYAIDVCLNKPIPHNFSTFIQTRKNLCETFNSCNVMLDVLKRQKISKELSIYDILIRRVDSLVQFLGNEDNRKAIEDLTITSISLGIEKELEVYIDMAKMRIKLALERRRLLDSAVNILNDILSHKNLPIEMIWKILSYMNVRQLQKIVS